MKWQSGKFWHGPKFRRMLWKSLLWKSFCHQGWQRIKNKRFAYYTIVSVSPMTSFCFIKCPCLHSAAVSAYFFLQKHNWQYIKMLNTSWQVLVCLVFKHHVVSAVDPICPFSLCCRRMLPNYGWLIFGTLPKLLLARVLVRCGKTWVLPNSILELGGLWSVDSKDTRFKHKPFQWRCVAKKCQTLPKNYLFYCNAPLSPWPNKALPRQERLYSRNVWGLQRFFSLVNLPISMLIHSSWEWTWLIVEIWMHDTQI